MRFRAGYHNGSGRVTANSLASQTLPMRQRGISCLGRLRGSMVVS